MQIKINGERREFSQSTMTVGELMERLSLAPQRIAVEVNQQIVRRDEWVHTAIKDGDRIEIVHFVGGGTSGGRGGVSGCPPRDFGFANSRCKVD